MVSRSHSATFNSLRNKASKYAKLSTYDSNDEERITLVNNDSQFNENDTSDLPYWLTYVDQFRFESIKVNQKSSSIDHLEEVQKKMIKLKNKEIFEENSIAEEKTEEIDHKCQEISNLFSRLHSLVNELRNVPKLEGCKKRLLVNILQWEYQVISDLSAKFRDVEQVYLNKIREYDEYMIKFEESSNGPHNSTQNYFSEQSFLIDQESQMEKFKEHTLSDAKYIKDREREMNSILNSIEELNQIFQDINTAVISQGSLLDRIDYNMEIVDLNVARGTMELNNAAKRVRRSRKMKLIFFIAISILLLLLLVALNPFN